MLKVLKKIIKNTGVFRLYSECRIRRNEINRFIDGADKCLSAMGNNSHALMSMNRVYNSNYFTPPILQSDQNIEDQHRILKQSVFDIRKAYIRDLKKYMFDFDEWFYQYELYNAPESKKQEFISRSKAQKCYRKLVKSEIRDIFHYKPKFIRHFSNYIFRKTLACNEITSAEKINSILTSESIIIKPQAGSLGAGVTKITRDQIEKINLVDFTAKCRAEKILIEECIVGDDSLQSFHPQSLNTIRVMTAFNGTSASLFGSFVRFGRGGSIVDNAHGGGIYCTVDITDGTLLTNAFDVHGNEFETHPDTGIRFKGFQIPKWEDIKQSCCNAHETIDIPFVGWDVCINSKGQIEFIEGNHAPDMDIIQGPLKKGYAKQFLEVCRQYQKHDNN